METPAQGGDSARLSQVARSGEAGFAALVTQIQEALPAHLPRVGPELLVALDIDGTLVAERSNPSDRVREAVAALQARGAHIVLATGRGISGSLPLAQQLGLDLGRAVLSNGAISVRWDGTHPRWVEVLHVHEFDPTAVLTEMIGHYPGRIVGVELAEEGFRVCRQLDLGRAVPRDVAVVDLAELHGRPVTRVVVEIPPGAGIIAREVARRTGMVGIEYHLGGKWWVDIAPPEVSKAQALARLCPELGVSPAATVAVGDGENDIEMVQWAGCGVAMHREVPELVAVADVVAAPVTVDGAAAVMQALLQRG